MCDFGACQADATHYVVTHTPPGAAYRTALCRPHLELAHRAAGANLTKITEYGRLDRAWAVHSGGRNA